MLSGTRIAAVGTAVAVLALATACVEIEPDDDSSDQTGGPGSVPMDVVEQGGQTLALIEVSIAGEGPFPFAIDTGASVTTVDADIADELDLPRTGESRRVTGIAGSQEAEIVQVDDWRMGEIALAPTELAALDLPEPERGQGLQGLLGSDVLSGFGEVVIDYDAEVLTVPDSGESP